MFSCNECEVSDRNGKEKWCVENKVQAAAYTVPGVEDVVDIDP